MPSVERTVRERGMYVLSLRKMRACRMTETQAIERYRKQHPGWLVIKLHGGEFQSGLPDTIVIDECGNHTWLEWKIGKQAKWRANQHAMMLKLQRQKARVFYAIVKPDRSVELVAPDIAPVPAWIASGCERGEP